jgi:hypothetical protein
MTATGGMPAYTTSKAAVLGLTRGLARDLGPFNIRANTVSPGWVMTERQKKLWVTPEGEKQLDQLQCLKGRLQPEDLANMVLFLSSEDAKMITSQNFVVDAGWTSALYPTELGGQGLGMIVTCQDSVLPGQKIGIVAGKLLPARFVAAPRHALVNKKDVRPGYSRVIELRLSVGLSESQQSPGKRLQSLKDRMFS